MVINVPDFLIRATEKLLLRSRQLVDVKKDDGFAALHLACLNGHRAVAETLLVQGQAEVDLRNNRRQTPLILAVCQVSPVLSKSETETGFQTYNLTLIY